MVKKSMFTAEGMRARFNELTAEHDRLIAELEPLQEKRDAYVNETAAKVKEMDAEIRKLRDPLFEVDQERGLLVKALSGKTGDPHEKSSDAEADETDNAPTE